MPTPANVCGSDAKNCSARASVSAGVVVGNSVRAANFPSPPPMAHTNLVPPHSIPPYIGISSLYRGAAALSTFLENNQRPATQIQLSVDRPRAIGAVLHELLKAQRDACP